MIFTNISHLILWISSPVVLRMSELIVFTVNIDVWYIFRCWCFCCGWCWCWWWWQWWQRLITFGFDKWKYLCASLNIWFQNINYSLAVLKCRLFAWRVICITFIFAKFHHIVVDEMNTKWFGLLPLMPN